MLKREWCRRARGMSTRPFRSATTRNRDAMSDKTIEKKAGDKGDLISETEESGHGEDFTPLIVEKTEDGVLSPLSTAPPDEYSEGQWMKWDPEDIRRREQMEFAYEYTGGERSMTQPQTQAWLVERPMTLDILDYPYSDPTTTTDDRNSLLTEESQRPTGPPIPGANEELVPPGTALVEVAEAMLMSVEVSTIRQRSVHIEEPKNEGKQTYRIGTVDTHLPYWGAKGLPTAVEAVPSRPVVIKVYDTESESTAASSVDQGKSNSSTSGIVSETDGIIGDENSAKMSKSEILLIQPSEAEEDQEEEKEEEKQEEKEDQKKISRDHPAVDHSQSKASSSSKVEYSPSSEKLLQSSSKIAYERDCHNVVQSRQSKVPKRLLFCNLVAALIFLVLSQMQVLERISLLNETMAIDRGLFRSVRPVCREPHCSAAGAQLFFALDTTADPCESAFDVVCRPWLHETPAAYRRVVLGSERVFVDDVFLQADKILRSRDGYRPVAKSEEKLILLYERCLDSRRRDLDGLDYFRQLMGEYELSQWPYRDKDVRFGRSQTGLQRLMRDTGSDPYFKLYLGRDFSNTHFLTADCPSLGLPPLSFVSKTADVTHYTKYVQLVIREIAAKEVNSEEVAQSIVEFETDLARLHVLCCNAKTMYTKRNTDDLVSDHFDWREFLESVTETTAWSGVLRAKHWDFVLNATAIIGRGGVAESNYLGWKVASSLIPYTTTRLAKLTGEFLASAGLHVPPTFRVCLAQVNHDLPLAMGRFFVRGRFQKSTSHEVYKVAYHLARGLDDKVRRARWFGGRMDGLYRQLRATMNMTLGYPDWMEEDALLDSYYASVRVTGSYLESHISAARTANRRSFDPSLNMWGRERLMFPGDSMRWEHSLPSMYDIRENRFYLLPANLQPPEYVEGTVASLNYGSFGFLLARDLVQELFLQRETTAWSKAVYESGMLETMDCLVKRVGSIAEPASVVTSILAAKLSHLSYQMQRDFMDDATLDGFETLDPDRIFFIAVARTLCGITRNQNYVSLVSLRARPAKRQNLVDRTLLGLSQYQDAFNCSRSRGGDDYQDCFTKRED